MVVVVMDNVLVGKESVRLWIVECKKCARENDLIECDMIE